VRAGGFYLSVPFFERTHLPLSQPSARPNPQRQLNIYGFHKLACDRGVSFGQKFFRRGCSHFLRLVVRRGPARHRMKGRRASGEPPLAAGTVSAAAPAEQKSPQEVELSSLRSRCEELNQARVNLRQTLANSQEQEQLLASMTFALADSVLPRLSQLASMAQLQVDELNSQPRHTTGMS
jgi:hypothetical protein